MVGAKGQEVMQVEEECVMHCQGVESYMSVLRQNKMCKATR